MDQDTRRRIYAGGWRVEVVRRAGVAQPLTDAGMARQVQYGLGASGAPKPGSVTVVLTDDAELTDLNRQHMGVDAPTDVLSFPMLEPSYFQRGGENRARSSIVKDVERLRRASPRGRIHIGDIAISVERAIEQALEGRGGHTADVRWSPEEELRLLVTHGALHLCGWDHAAPDEEAAMRALERELLESRPPPGRRPAGR